ncbi:hypothetical protein ColTof4_03496 [Colletotrichum tofieldiae]|nr:hypothetical protein ColTof3_13078 [Colletotrichum tofieldiae]GKT71073.1 hypothetical protein ColTof4_03496 [Colletotrichum tofieldiae]GKT94011.1 hypothetical protein Ct61P_11861 [Colletotrichum tofieldiae]
MRIFTSAWLFAVTAQASLSSIASLRCSDGLLPTPSYNLTRALFTVCTEETINAPIQAIYDTVIDFRRYSEWNTFVVEAVPPPTVQGPEDAYLEMPVKFTSAGIIPFFNASSNEVVTLLAPDVEDEDGLGRVRAVAGWRNDDGFNGYVLAAEHPNILTDLGNGSVRMISYETFYLPGAALLLLSKGTLQERFDTQARDLKRYLERGL